MSTAAIDVNSNPAAESTRGVAHESPAVPRFDPFASLTRAEREREQEAYLAYLRRRDGEIDWEAWALPVRDERTQRASMSETDGRVHVDIDAFYQLFHRAGAPSADAATKWASLIALANENEFYGVQIEEQMLKKKGRGVDELMVFHVLQEHFHTRLIAEACRIIGLPRVTPQRPRLLHRLVVGSMGYLTDWLRYPSVLLGEAVATVVFDKLYEHCSLFDDDPIVADRLRAIIREIRHDEILHVLHCRSRLPGPMMAIARALIPVATWVIEKAYPQILTLGMDRRTLADGLRRGIEIPEGIDWIRCGRIAPA